jgi:hypothetical protein
MPWCAERVPGTSRTSQIPTILVEVSRTWIAKDVNLAGQGPRNLPIRF